LEELQIPEGVKRVLMILMEGLEEELGDFRLYLFGSYARGDWVEGLSDVDIIVVSPAFRGKGVHERCATVRRLAGGLAPLDILCYTPEELERLLEESTFLREASRHWIRLH
jgi:predicted nucleotidyltransferase